MARPVIAVLNGANLNLLGERDPATYGRATLSDIEALCRRTAEELGYDVDFRQTNHEGVLVEQLHEVRATAAGVVLNPAAFTHTSVAVSDAAAVVRGPVIEVHLSNIHRREAFRHHSFVTPVADGVIAGCGPHGYALALRQVDHLLGDAGGKEAK